MIWLLLLLWFIASALAFSKQIYWWQIKEYRLDRFLVFLRTYTGKLLFLDTLGAIFVLFLTLIFVSYKDILVLGFFLVILLQSLATFNKKTLKRPLPTLRGVIT